LVVCNKCGAVFAYQSHCPKCGDTIYRRGGRRSHGARKRRFGEIPTQSPEKQSEEKQKAVEALEMPQAAVLKTDAYLTGVKVTIYAAPEAQVIKHQPFFEPLLERAAEYGRERPARVYGQGVA